MRFCVDCRLLNKVTVPDAYRLPAKDDTMEALGGYNILGTRPFPWVSPITLG
jgi:hypothetical protein